MQAKWKKLKSKVVYRNPYFKIKEDDVISPTGLKTKYYYLSRDKSVSVIAEDGRGKIYLVGQAKYPPGNIYSWETVAGGVYKNESFLQGAKRELKEEISMAAKRWIYLGYFFSSGGTTNQIVKIYLAKDLKKVKSKADPTELIKIRKEKISEVVKMIKNNQITDGFTIVAIYKYLLYKNKI